MPTTTPNITLRDYQQECLDNIMKEVEQGTEAAGIHLPTGTGKSIIQVTAIKQLLERDPESQAALVVPADHLVKNALKNLHLLFRDDEIGIVKSTKNDFLKRVSIVSIQTALREHRMNELHARYRWVIVDEMHMFLAKKFRTALEGLQAPHGMRIGFSATILREDRKSLSTVFGKLIYHKSLWEMIGKGWLAPLKGLRLDAEIDLDSIDIVAGDYNEKQLADVLSTDNAIEMLYKGWKEHAGDRVTMAFTPTIAMAQTCANYWNSKNEKADWVCGTGPKLSEKDLETKTERFVAGETQIVFNAAKWVVGFDHPPIGCVFMIRPTKSQTFYIQCAGRGTRPCKPEVYTQSTLPIADRVLPKKDDCLILDVSGATENSLIQFPDLFDLPAHLLKEVRAEIAKHPGETWGTDDLFEAYEEMYRAKGLVASRVDLVGESRFAWIKTAVGWALSLGTIGDIKLESMDDGFVIHEVQQRDLTREETEKYRGALDRCWVQGNTIVTLHQRKVGDNATATSEPVTQLYFRKDECLQAAPIPLDYAMSMAELRVHEILSENRGVAKLVDKEAPWRKEPLSEKLFYLVCRHCTGNIEVLPLLKYGSYTDYIYAIPEDQLMTKGRASELFGEVSQRWDAQKQRKAMKTHK